jgi:beta-lactamase regulating signal transducer with metallopeptidase domain
MNALTGSSWLSTCIWQSTLFLGFGGLLSLLWHRRPARSHRILILSMAACLITPLLSHAVHHYGWGFLRPNHVAYSTDVSPSRMITPSPIASISPAPVPASAPAAEPPGSSLTTITVAAVETPSRSAPFSRQELLIGTWITLSVLVLLRLIVSLLREVVMLRRAVPLHDETILQALNRVIDHLNLRVDPVVCTSGQVSSPVICCWGRRPTLVVPQIRPSADTPEAWFGILCHELAHWKRRDHWAFLMSEFLTCWLPWHPLVWWTRQRLNQLSELACDNWVLACGQPAQVYAESLLGLLPQRRAVCALPAVSLRTKLGRRIHSIMADRPANPLPGGKWAWSSLAVAVVMAAVAAFAQSASVSEPAADKPAEGLTDYMPSGMTLRLVEKGYYSDLTSCPSRDGKCICVANSDACGWIVRDQTTGKERLLTSDPCGLTFVSVISPDNRRVVYEWMDGTTQLAKELRLIDLDGGTPRVVYTNAASLYLYPVQWSEDSRVVLALVKTADDNQAILVDMAASAGKLSGL